MAKNIMLVFLSTVRINKTDFTPEKSYYQSIDGKEIQMTNESAVHYLLQKNINLDRIFIFASKKVRKPIFAGASQTHKDFFLELLAKLSPNTAYTVYEYNEDNTGDENLKSVAEVARLIQDFSKNEEVILHVDLTGGMRHISMIMLELTRLLEYSGLKVGSVLYSNYDSDTKVVNVEELKNVYDLFQLIAGVEEFVNFGSVKALTDKDKGYYTDKKISEPLKKLLVAMENFAEAIKLCHYGQFRKAIENLHNSLRYFEDNLSDDVQDTLITQLIERIRKDYDDLIANLPRDDLEIIRWCLEHDYLQQALTLYTERIPEYLGEKNFIIQSKTEHDKLSQLIDKDDMNRNRFYYLLNVCTSRTDFTGKGLRIYCTDLKDQAVLAIRKRKFNFDAWFNGLNKKLSQGNISITDEPRLRLQLDTLAKVAQMPKELFSDLDSPELDSIRELIDEFHDELADEQVNVFIRAQNFFKRISKLPNDAKSSPLSQQETDIINLLVGESAEKLEQQFGLKNIKKEFREVLRNKIKQSQPKQKALTEFFPDVIFAKDIYDKYPRAHKLYLMIRDGIFSLNNISEEKFLSIMEKYFRIRKERNQSNHAREDFGEFPTAESLREFMREAIKELKETLVDG